LDCGGERSDAGRLQLANEGELQQWMEDLQKNHATNTQPVPSPRNSRRRPIPPWHGRSFDPQKVVMAVARQAQARASASAIKPDLDRRRETLEGFPLDQIRMVGMMRQSGNNVALVESNGTRIWSRSAITWPELWPGDPDFGSIRRRILDDFFQLHIGSEIRVTRPKFWPCNCDLDQMRGAVRFHQRHVLPDCRIMPTMRNLVERKAFERLAPAIKIGLDGRGRGTRLRLPRTAITTFCGSKGSTVATAE